MCLVLFHKETDMNTRQSLHVVRLASSFILLFVLLFGQIGQAFAATIVIYVRSNASGANNGISWIDAYTDLQSALASAVSGDEIWVAAGMYKPTAGIDRTATFTLKNGVVIYGGFAGTETLLTQRNPAGNATILSGDIGTLNNASDNSYHVITGSSTDSTAILDGFTITAGNANGGNGTADPENNGAGIYNNFGSPTLINITISGNTASQSRGGIYNYHSSPS